MARRKNTEWSLPDLGETVTVDQAQLAVLMDIRDELQRLNALFNCSNFLAIPHTLRAIEKNTRPKRKRSRSK